MLRKLLLITSLCLATVPAFAQDATTQTRLVAGSTVSQGNPIPGIAPPVAVAIQQSPGQNIIQQSPTELRACSTINATAAVNNTATVTLTPPAGMYVYLCGIDIVVSNDATGGVVATNLSFTSTNLGGWALKYSMVGTANTNGLVYSTPAGMLIKSAAPGTAVTIVSPAANAHASYSINAYYYYAP